MREESGLESMASEQSRNFCMCGTLRQKVRIPNGECVQNASLGEFRQKQIPSTGEPTVRSVLTNHPACSEEKYRMLLIRQRPKCCRS